VEGETIVPIKGLRFPLAQLLADGALESRYRGGLCLVFRLAPMDYHRFCYVDDGEHGPVRRIPGYYHSVHPLALRAGIPALATNYRELTVLETRNFGSVVHIDVGALGVGKIVQHRAGGGPFQRGEEKGYFEWGASTTLLLLQTPVCIDDDIMHYSRQGIETRVRYGSRIGRRKIDGCSTRRGP
jgi:phosphatidylserine decarboxylase